MTPEQEKMIKDEVDRQVKEMVGNFFSQRYLHQIDSQYSDGRNVIFGRTTGTQIGTETDQKLAFHGVTPVVQQSTISDASGCTGNADTKVNEVIDVLQAYGFIA